MPRLTASVTSDSTIDGQGIASHKLYRETAFQGRPFQDLFTMHTIGYDSVDTDAFMRCATC